MVEDRMITPAMKKRMFDKVNELSFAVVEMTEYLDTHPYEKEAIDYFCHLNKECNKAKKEYSEHVSPLEVDAIDQLNSGKMWRWALEDLPWR